MYVRRESVLIYHVRMKRAFVALQMSQFGHAVAGVAHFEDWNYKWANSATAWPRRPTFLERYNSAILGPLVLIFTPLERATFLVSDTCRILSFRIKIGI